MSRLPTLLRIALSGTLICLSGAKLAADGAFDDLPQATVMCTEGALAVLLFVPKVANFAVWRVVGFAALLGVYVLAEGLAGVPDCRCFGVLGSDPGLPWRLIACGILAGLTLGLLMTDERLSGGNA